MTESIWRPVRLDQEKPGTQPWDAKVYKATPTDPAFLEVMVPSSKGDGTVYEVIVFEERKSLKLTCTCPSGQYRGNCRHADEVWMALKKRMARK